MPDLGKVDRQFFDAYIYPRLGADRDDVSLGPTHGVDFGCVDVDGTALVVATDPISVLPALGWERAGRFALDIVLADVAVSGLPPSHLAIEFSLPPDVTDEEFAAVWRAVDERATELGVAVVTGHTARYTGCSFPWVGGATAMAVGDPDDVVRPDGARPGDRLLVTKGPAVEATGLLTTLYGDRMGLDDETLETARERLDEASVVEEAAVAAAAGPVTAMHDATEGGLAGALNEMADGASVRFDVERERVPLRPGVAATCDHLGMDPWAATSSGTLVLTVAPDGVEAVCEALAAEGVPVGVVGDVREGNGVYLDGDRLSAPERDPSWDVYAEFAGADAERE